MEVAGAVESDDVHNTLTWQSIFWAVVPIALNTMNQQTGRIMGYPSSYNFVLRCSPIVCGASVIDSCIRTISYVYEERSISNGMLRFRNWRFQDRQGQDDGSFNSLRHNRVFRALLFFLGAVPQAIKLCATGGIPWTQAWITIYLAAYLLDEVLMAASTAIGQTTTNVAATTTVTGSHYRVFGFTVYQAVARAVLWSSVAFAFGFFTHSVYVFSTAPLDQLQWPRLLALLLLAVLWLSLAVFRVREALTFLVASTTIPTFALVSALLSRFSNHKISVELRKEGWGLRIMLGVVASVALLATVFSFERLWKRAASGRLHFVLLGFSVYYVLLHLLAAVLYYSLVYDATTTSKPYWTDMLG